MPDIIKSVRSIISGTIILTAHKILMRLLFVMHYVKWRRKRYFLKKQTPDRKIIAINLIEHLGDIVACEPVSRYMRRTYPDAYIVWSVRRTYRELVDNNPCVNESLVVLCLAEWIMLSKTDLFDEIVDLHINGRVCPYCRVPLSKSAGNRDISLDNYYSFGNLLSIYCQSAGLPVIDDQPAVYIPQQVVAAIDAMGLPDNYVVVHCSSNEADRDWLTAKWHDLIKRLIGKFHVHFVEVGLRCALKDTNSYCYTSLCRKLSILETAEVIKRAQLFIGVDSGPAQLSNAVGTYGIILIGHYRTFKRYMPYSGGYGAGTRATVLYEDGPLATLAVERVYQEAGRYLKKRGFAVAEDPRGEVF